LAAATKDVPTTAAIEMRPENGVAEEDVSPDHSTPDMHQSAPVNTINIATLESLKTEIEHMRAEMREQNRVVMQLVARLDKSNP
jgi:hypothetical protein